MNKGIEYIRTTKDIIREEIKGRYTSLEQGVPGFILKASNINSLHGLSEKERVKCLRMLDEAKEENRVLALVQGYPCLLNESDFVRCNPPKIYPVSAEII